ncbi:MAG: hypothetical protein GVY24_05970 [Planctomycetes bacterium]|jgi:hypothetical protein|nr:hypothetical protein [Planctomycetota bacterium]
MTDLAAPMRCVVVLPRGAGVERAPASLLAGLSQRRLDVVIAADAPTAMVELARRATAVMVVVEPGRQPQVGELVRAVRAYYPKVVCWRYDQQDADRGRLSAINGTYGEASSHAGAGSEAGSAPMSPGKYDPVEDEELERVLGRTRQRLDPLVTRVQHPPRESSSPLISEQELAMLLGQDEPGWSAYDGESD